MKIQLNSAIPEEQRKAAEDIVRKGRYQDAVEYVHAPPDLLLVTLPPAYFAAVQHETDPPAGIEFSAETAANRKLTAEIETDLRKLIQPT